MKITKSRDGIHRTDMHITVRVGIGELTQALCSARRNHGTETDGPLPILTKTQIQKEVKDEYALRGCLQEGWSDYLSTDETYDRLAWAEMLVRAAYPELDKADPRTVTPVKTAPAPDPATRCVHGTAIRADADGNPIDACAKADGGTDWGAFNAEGCHYRHDCAVDVANESAKANEEADPNHDFDPENTWDEMCRDHDGEPKNGCQECYA